ncbi:uncharacterized protein SCHCODRAFT_02729121 [Schizophyllum commune H4-8]|uniref:uncharacterized protein n=1 Tax=Schizophyllum commune (strain H4-8 / FGSC 9210) TaxID=578458 RepID=UPI002160B8F1|nr:uncharacterized protein SCHCODRAFT_02729121 [Schizophyllum commune H4-8]KAI5893011.1 hypothetical protein SCHCODRAFT_02729121 [Schizophyllum commune H4-8]
MTVCPRIPLEILYLVVHKSDRPTLAVLMRTTTALSREAKPLFFASISVASAGSMVSLSRALAQGQFQSSWLRRLHVIYPPVHLPRFSNVTSLRWSVSPFSTGAFSPSTLRDAMSSFPSLVALALYEGPRTSHELDVVLSPVAPMLQTLELAFHAPFAISTSTFGAHFPALRELIFADGFACDLGAFLGTFRAVPPIEVLRVPAFCSWETLRRILPLFASSLRVLDVDVLTSVVMYSDRHALCFVKGMDHRRSTGRGGVVSC